MRLPPNRLFPWLPLLLFACFTPALAAQSWTTVWTPDNATPAKVVAKGGNHDSKTNCYPCKEWEDYGDGTGKWVFYPEGTEPIVCAGDTNDYTCRECDGAGDVQDKDNYTECGTCRCCEGGVCIHYPDNCPNPPPPPSVAFVKAGPCPCSDPTQLGCTVPASYPIPMPSIDVCLQNCTWVPVVESITVEYFEGPCPNNCQNTIQSANDVNAGNYCAIKDAIQDRITSIGPHAPPPNGAPGPEDYCFEACLQVHEDVHIGQLGPEWAFYWNLMLDDIAQISVPFDCETTRTESQARAAMLHDVALVMLNNYPNFLYAWGIPDRGEADAYQAESTCLQDLANQIQQMANANGWICP